MIWDGELKVWTLEGYAADYHFSHDLMVRVLTPESSVNALRSGSVPQVAL